MRRSSPITAAGPSRIRTGFPFLRLPLPDRARDSAHLSASQRSFPAGETTPKNAINSIWYNILFEVVLCVKRKEEMRVSRVDARRMRHLAGPCPGKLGFRPGVRDACPEARGDGEPSRVMSAGDWHCSQWLPGDYLAVCFVDTEHGVWEDVY